MYRSLIEVIFSSHNVSDSLLTEAVVKVETKVLILRREGREIYGGQSAHVRVRQIFGDALLFASAAALQKHTRVAVSGAFHIQ